jgi:hypothetical protein
LGKNFDPIDKHFRFFLNNCLVQCVEAGMPLRNVTLIAFLAFAGFCLGQTSPLPANTGIDGIISVAPIHPGPERPGIPNSNPLANTTFVVANQAGGAASEFTTDDQGHFKILLEPGHYTVAKKGAPTKIGRCGPFEAFVVAGQINHVEWRCDSGMR